MKRLCTICARAGSKGVTGKNTRLLAGIPLIAHSIRQAKDSDLFDAVAVSSDSEAILAVAEQWGVEHLIKRPAEMATDQAAKVPAIRHCAEVVEKSMGWRFDTVVDLAVTSPLRAVEDIVGAVALLESRGVTNVGTGSAAERSPYYNIVELNADDRVRYSKTPETPIYRRQDAPACYDLSGAIYAWKRDWLISGPDKAIGDETLLYVMPRERSQDIDTEIDFRIAEMLIADRP